MPDATRLAGMIVLLLAAPGAVTPAQVDPVTRCQSDKLGALAKASKGVFACAPKDLSGVTLSGFDSACLGEASPKLLLDWARAIAKADAKGASCFNAPDAGTVGESLVTAASDASAALRAGFAPEHDAVHAAVVLLNSAMKAAEVYLRATLTAQARNVTKPDPEKLAKSLAKASATLQQRVDAAARKAADLDVAWTGNAGAAAAALDAHVQALLLDLTTNPVFPVARLVDSGVSGVTYAPGLDAGPNLTLPGGLFPVTDVTMSFAVGGIALGEAAVSATGFVTPVSLVPGAVDESHPVVTNMARFLQSIDDDGKAANGIAIPAAVLAEVSATSLDFSDEQAVVVLAQSLTAFTAKGARLAVSAAQAQDHLQQALLGVFAGSYAGTFGGDDSGTWKVTITDGGKISGSGFSNDVGKLGIQGTLDSSGGLDAVAGTVSTGARFEGTVDLLGTISGVWVNLKFNENGTFAGALVP